jgi:molybdopterin-binding protein
MQIRQCDAISIINFEAQGQALSMMALTLTFDLEVGSKVLLNIKASNIAVAKDLSGDLSISNRLHVSIESITKGELLCALGLRFGESLLESIITRDSCERLDLHVGNSITALIKSSELSIIGLDT